MAFTLDPATPYGQVRYLIGDTIQAKADFQDEELQGFINMAPYNSLYLACALALDSLASKASRRLNNLTLGSLTINDTNKVAALQKQAQNFRDLEYNTPAFAVVEENLSSFNQLIIIRNWVLKTEI